MNNMNAQARVLIVDDSIANTCLLTNVLNRLGFAQIESINDPRQTFERLQVIQPDLIILDLDMPHLSGFEVMQQLSKLPRERFLPILVISGDSTVATKRKALAAGGTDFLPRPFDPSEVFMRIRNLLQIRFLQGQLQDHNRTLEEKVAARTRELREAQDQIIVQERLRAFGEMAGGIVHDFNNALMSVIGYSEILLADDEVLANRDTAREFLTVIHAAGQDASHVISRLRDFYRPREITDIFSPVDLNAILQQAVPLTQPKWKAQPLAEGRVIEVKLDLAKVPPISGNESSLREVVTNLIFNAVDAMPAGGTITLRTDCDGTVAIVEVIDEGLGMTDEVRHRCLEPFFSTKGEKGTGLGLSMVFGIVKRHEGSLEIESTLGKGTTFRLRFPSLVDSPAAAEAAPATIARSLHVLVVDDEPVSRQVVASYLTLDGHRVVTVDNAEDAVGQFEGAEFDLLITDLAMPRMSGVQLAAAVRQSRAEQPVILLTGFNEDAIGAANQPAEVDLIMRKPVQRRALQRALASLCKD